MTKRKTNDEFIREVYNLVRNEYTFLENYINAITKIKVRHNCDECGNYEYYVKPNHFLTGIRCPKCSGLVKKTTEIFKKEIFELTDNEYEILGEYINSSTKIKIMHKNDSCDNYTYDVTPSKFLTGRRCPRCSGKERKTTKSFKNEIFKLVGDEYVVIGEYINNRTPIKMKHSKCNTILEVKPNHFLIGRRCPKCNMSKGETRVAKELDKLDIKYETEYDGFNIIGVNGGLLRFDFFFTHNKVKHVIEYDGEYHYMKKHKNDGHETLREHDEMKDEFCRNNNVRILRIPYWYYDKIERLINYFIE